jgi:hypothetical protein
MPGLECLMGFVPDTRNYLAVGGIGKYFKSHLLTRAGWLTLSPLGLIPDEKRFGKSLSISWVV